MLPHLNALEEIFRSALERVDPEKLIHNSVTLKGSILRVNTPELSKTFDMDHFERIVVVGFGKATAKMAKAVEKLLGDRINEGVISVKYGHTETLERIRTIEAGHPIPDHNGIEAARQITDVAQRCDQKTLVITLISGGGSALIPYPYSATDGDCRITLEEKQAVTQTLLGCGAVINEVNCLRKHLSLVKGGRLAQMLYPATSLNLILSDVVGDSLDTIASGPTSWDNTTFDDVAQIIDKYDIAVQLPQPVRNIFDRGLKGQIPDTPAMNDKIFSTATNCLVGTNYLSLLAAKEKAQALGYSPVVLSSQIIGEAREVARVYCGIGKDAKRKDLLAAKPMCLIAGGETTVTLKGKGKGGRNQEMALAFLSEIAQDRDATQGIYFLAASTDGNDGPTEAAGAFASNDILAVAQEKRLNISDHLKRNDAYSFFESAGFLLKTGPTNTNVCDIQLMIVL